uniref:Deoxyuridine 5'-triphosphate nucleotidohydrolase n=1 Tax=Gopherus agassizii TaxID=38772 RepID=A0A452H0W8_9SAUR
RPCNEPCPADPAKMEFSIVQHVFAFQQLHPQAQLPIRATPGSAGLDLRVPQESLTLQANSRNLISIGLAIALPQGYYGRIAPRSMGVIDADYTGEVKVLLVHNKKTLSLVLYIHLIRDLNRLQSK